MITVAALLSTTLAQEFLELYQFYILQVASAVYLLHHHYSINKHFMYRIQGSICETICADAISSFCAGPAQMKTMHHIQGCPVLSLIGTMLWKRSLNVYVVVPICKKIVFVGINIKYIPSCSVKDQERTVLCSDRQQNHQRIICRYQNISYLKRFINGGTGKIASLISLVSSQFSIPRRQVNISAFLLMLGWRETYTKLIGSREPKFGALGYRVKEAHEATLHGAASIASN